LNFKTYVTGSNSRALTLELNTVLRGRTYEIRVLPLSYKEIHSYNNGATSDDVLLNDYYLYGGLPELTKCSSNEEKKIFLSNYVVNLVKREIIERYLLRYYNRFMAFLKIILSSIGSEISIIDIANTLTSLGYKKVSTDTISKYIKYCIEANILSQNLKYSIKNKRDVAFNNKYYCFDIGVRNAILGFTNTDKNALLENIIYNEFENKNCIVCLDTFEYYQMGLNILKSYEIDFIVNNFKNIYCIQVCPSLDEKITLERKLLPFDKIQDKYKKILITNNNTLSHIQDKGYYILDIIEFLLNDSILDDLK
jgi:predicted AAA+ superfamily ATPase